MQQPLPFDPNYYFSLVADNLLKNFGDKAIGYADHALNKMKAIGDDEGFNIWVEIHAQLTNKSAIGTLPAGATMH
ncbi:hypothetical protein [Kordiimonas aquimaris]|uniref:hypothetical protein n=1 Tax=Kordiimonas aquimaris TaxID=707591 RepID=UPI0021D351CD|nr:hypothetical protein [Kordiimonas aquimaris]